ncbi:hypothetical protein PYCCODRAFT_1457492 [Trametes coccinea BRFM310]|uniref:Uncharacterized protein n=1 Tax=Trametes coccinea (strain BRFM310) TaxID=1353009 RepID=A0A1Y2IXQ0_TRAC3|nr:hypothetical protein PYCCODRAFT_1457492 [Trametes coccinea BRFM310]
MITASPTSSASSTTVLQSPYQAGNPHRPEADGESFLGVPPDRRSYDFTKLSQSIYQLQIVFREIATGLALYESRTGVRPRGVFKLFHRSALKPATTLTARWDGLRKNWDNLLQDSRKHALSAYAVLHQNSRIFRGFGTQRDAKTCEALALEVQNLKEVIKDKQAISDTMRARFSSFRDDISLFKANLEKTLREAASNSKAAFDEYAETTLRKFAVLQEDLKKFDEEMTATDIAFSACFAQCLLLKRLPDMKAKVEAEVVKRNKTVKKLEQKHIRLMELEHSLQVMVGVLDSFVDNANTVEDAWEAICHQFCELDALLEVAVSGTITTFFGTKLDSTFDTYEGLKDILYGYAIPSSVWDAEHLVSDSELDLFLVFMP